MTERSLVELILEDLNDIKKAIETAEEQIHIDFLNIKKSIDRLLTIGIPREMIIIYISEKAKIPRTVVKRIINALESATQRDLLRDFLIMYIARIAGTTNKRVRKFLESYQTLLEELTKRRGENDAS